MFMRTELLFPALSLAILLSLILSESCMRIYCGDCRTSHKIKKMSGACHNVVPLVALIRQLPVLLSMSTHTSDGSKSVRYGLLMATLI